jgi:predicted peptidase
MHWMLHIGALMFCAVGIGAGVASAANVPGEAVFYKDVYTNKSGDKMPYRLFVPPGYDANKKYPLIFWLHGANGRGTDNERQTSKADEKGTHVWTLPANQAQFPAFVVAPQCPENRFWTEPELNEPTPQLLMALEILNEVEKKYSIDADRVYPAGQSMGGLGVWALLQAYPERWAAGLVLCAYDNFTNVRALTHIPVWVFQGDADLIVPVETVRQMVKDLKKAGGNVRYNEYHKVAHDVWEKAFTEPDLVSWVAQQKRGRLSGQ